MSLLDSLRQIRFKQNSIKYHADRIETNMKNAIDAVIDKGKYTATGEETIDDLPTLIDNIETTRRYPNGTEWTNIAGVTNTLGTLEYHNGLWILAFGNALVYSTDAKNWIAAVDDTGANVQASFVIYHNDMWIATTMGINCIYYSLDGITWINVSGNITPISGTVATEYVIMLSHTNDKWLIITISGIYYSTDGINWNQSDISNLSNFNLAGHRANGYAPTTDTINHGLRNLFLYNNGIIVGFSGYNIIYSTDGITWYDSNASEITSYSVILSAGASAQMDINYGGGVWITCFGGTVIYSEDGITWTPTSISSVSYTGSCAYHNGIWILKIASITAAFRSVDGKTWTASSLPPYISIVDYFNGVWFISTPDNTSVTSGYYYTYYSKDDGLTWTSMKSPFIVLGYNGSVCIGCIGNGIYYTTDFTNFTLALDIVSNTNVIPSTVYGYPQVLYKNGIWVLRSDGRLLYSICWER